MFSRTVARYMNGPLFDAVPMTRALFLLEPRSRLVQMVLEKLRFGDHRSSIRCCGGRQTARWYSSKPTTFPPYNRTFTRPLITRNRRKATPQLPLAIPHAEDGEKERPRERSRRGSILAPELVNSICIRSARPEDCGDILGLIQDFALWEGSLDKVEITEEDLIRDGFGELPFFRCVVAEASGNDSDVTSVVAYGLYYFSYCAWKGRMIMWEDIYVHEDYRGFGLGAILLHQVSKYAYGLGCRRVAGYVDVRDEKVARWYKNYGFVDFTDEHNYNIFSLADDSLDKFVADLDPFKKPRNMGIDVDFVI